MHCPPRIFLDSYKYFNIRKKMCAIMVRKNDHQKATQMTGHRYRETERRKNGRTYNIDWTPRGSSGPQCGDKCIATLDPHTGN